MDRHAEPAGPHGITRLVTRDFKLKSCDSLR